MNQPTRILCFASINLDQCVTVDRLPRVGETVMASDYQTFPGGKGANQAVSAARLGAQVDMVACVGSDDAGKGLRTQMEAEGIRLLGWHTVDAPTATAFILVDRNGQNQIVVAPGANALMTLAHVDAALAHGEPWDVAMTTLESPLATVRHLARRCTELGLPLLLDAGGSPAGLHDWESPWPFAMLTLNEMEAEVATGIPITDETSAHLAAQRLFARMHPEHLVVLKLGARGALEISSAGAVLQPAFAINAIDTVAAGDAHTAALAVSWRDRPRAESLAFANAAGGLACTKSGAYPALPHRAEVDALLQSHHLKRIAS